jgi:hypothetical protein
LTLTDAAGIVVQGATVLLSAKRLSDDNWYVGGGTPWQAGYGTVAMTEIDPAPSEVGDEGRYEYDLPIGATPDTYLLRVKYTHVDGTVDYYEDELLAFDAPSAAKLSALHDDRLTAARAGYLDELAAANVPADVDTLLARLTAIRAGLLDNLDVVVSSRSSLSAAEVNAEVDTALADYDGPTKAELDAGLAALNDPSDSEIATLLRTALGTNGSDVIAELAQEQPSATPSVAAAIMLLYMMVRNELDVTVALKSIKNDAGTVVCKGAVSDDGTTFQREKLVSGP